MLIILNLFKYADFKLLIINKKWTIKWNKHNVCIEPGLLAWKSNAQPFSLLATRFLVLHKAVAIYYSSNEILLV